MVYIGKTMTVSFNPSSPSTSSPFASAAPVAASRNAAALSSEAVDLSAQSAVVATLGGSISGAPVYSAAGLLNTLAQAGVSEETIAVPKAGSDTDSSQLAEQVLDQGILSAYAAAAGASGIYTAGGSSGLSDQVSSNWADILTSNPSYASAVVGSSFASGIISTLSVSA